MPKIKTTDIVAKIVDMLAPLSSDERRRVVDASLTLVGETPLKAAQGVAGKDQAAGGETLDLPARAQTWIKQNGLSSEEIHQVFHVTAEGAEVIASDIPGRNNKKKTYNAYVLTGIAKLLSTGDPSFDDKSARALCEASGCYDRANHAANLKRKGNEFTGSKSKGWTLTAPGLKHGAQLVKELKK